MPVYKAVDQSTEVNGETVCSVIDGMGAMKTKALKILTAHGIDNPQPGKWYSQQKWLDAFREIAESIGPNTLFMIGKHIPKNAKFPPEIDNVHKALGAIDVAYHMNHKIGPNVLFDPKTGKMYEGIGHYLMASTGDKSAKVTCQNPYPCDFDRGIVEQMTASFKPNGSMLTLKHDPSCCRSKGGESCTFLVSWT